MIAHLKISATLFRYFPRTILCRLNIPQCIADLRCLLSTKGRHHIIHKLLLELRIRHRHLQTPHCMLNMQFMLPIIDHNARLIRADPLLHRSSDLRPQFRRRFDDLVGVLSRGGLAVKEAAGGAVVDAEFAFEAVAGGLLAGELEDEGVHVEGDGFDGGDGEAAPVELGAPVDGGVDDNSARVGLECVLGGLPCA
jgi:hypothetical protein